MIERKPLESLTDHQADEFTDFALEMEATAKELNEAYLYLCKIKEGVPAEGKVHELYSKMEQLSDDGFPISRFADMIKNMHEHEHGEQVYLDYINRLPISEDEIRVLYSIVTKDREGELQFYLDGYPLMHFDVENMENRNDKAYLLTGALDRVMERVKTNGGQLTLLFTEK